MFRFAADIGIDLGTATVLVYVKDKGIVLKEPSVVAIDKTTSKMLAVGEEARRMLGRTPGHIVAIRPLRDGVIADYDITEMMLRYFINKVCGKRLLIRPRIMVCIPTGVTTVEKRAVLEATRQAGARKTYLIEEPVAAAIGAGLDISQPCGSMVVDIGGGTTDVAVLSLGNIVYSQSIRVAGDKFDDAIVRYVRKEFNIMIGERTAEEIKIEVGTAFPVNRDKTIEIRGRDLVTGLPKNLHITSAQTYEALQEPLQAILDCVHHVLERTPPELAADLSEKGIVMTGGGSLLHGLDKLISEKTGIPVHIAENPESCVAIGTGKALQWIDKLEPSLVTKPNGTR
ncbi:MAG: rod shape-determining protein MreB [Thermosediminibacterales bacterium]|nr:rod shape-determining protein MreB [Thermosediminibacterales bacterium]